MQQQLPQLLVRRTFLRRAVAGAAAAALAAWGLREARSGPAPHDLVDEGADFLDGLLEGTRVTAAFEVEATEVGGTLTSAPMQSAHLFTHVGLHWAGSPGSERLSFAVRTSPDGGAWGPWAKVGMEALPGETAHEETFGTLVYAGEARFVQYRVAFPAEDVGVSLLRVTAAAIDAGGAAPAARAAAGDSGPLTHRVAVGGLARDGLAANGVPTGHVVDAESGYALDVVTREAWGVDEGLRFDADVETWREMFVPPRLLVVHHSATRNGYESPAAAAADVRSIYHYHTMVLGWGDIGYHAIIDRFGNIYEGRHGRGGDRNDGGVAREALSAGVTGGHTTEYEYGTTGVALLGDGSIETWEMVGPAGARWEALVRFAVFEAARSALRPLAPGTAEAAWTDFLRSDNAWHDGVPTVGPHRGLQQTLCPSDAVIALLPALRQAVHNGLEGLSRAGVRLTSVTPAARLLPVGTPLVVTWAPEAPEAGWSIEGYEYAFEGWFKPADSEDIDYLSGYTSEPQPRLAWIPVLPAITQATFVASRPGQYTVHVRALLRNGALRARSAFKASRTILVE
ncbi:MAG: hypothetical protein ACR2HN_08135 [Tepidiformaceae bacterium]